MIKSKEKLILKKNCDGAGCEVFRVVPVGNSVPLEIRPGSGNGGIDFRVRFW